MGYGHTRLALFFLSLILIYFAHIITAQEFVFEHFCIYASGNYRDNSPYESNLDTALLEIPSRVNATDASGFSTFSEGQNSDDTVNILAMCRGDIDPGRCGQCVYNATLELKRVCPNQIEAIIWYGELCTLRYSSRSLLLQNSDNNLVYYAHSENNISSSDRVDQFIEDRNRLLNTLRPRAAAGGSLQKYEVGRVPGPAGVTIYGLMQCIPILSEVECNDCLTHAIDTDIPICCNNLPRGGRVIRAGCNLRYESDSFFGPTYISNTTDTTTPTRGSTRRTSLVIGVSIAVSVLLVIAGIWIFITMRKKMNPKTRYEKWNDDISMLEFLHYDLEIIATATNNFSDSNKLGQGGFGTVYKGKLPNGEEIAVKRLAQNSGQGEVEFKNEVVLLAKLQHRNLVRLLGFCLEGTERILIYEFMRNASLHHFVFDAVKSADLDWDRRYKVITGVARGLLYLHEDSRLRIIHRDLKASNILLDEEMNPKIADFGMARLFERDDESQGNTIRIVGTYGYMAPEYIIRGQFSVKSDVFSFGVLVLEIVSGQQNNGLRNGVSSESLLSYAWEKWQQQRFTEFIDPVLISSPISDMIRCIHIGLLCVQENVGDRPTMASIVLMLNSDSTNLPIPSEPAFLIPHNTAYSPENFHSGESNSTTGGSVKRNNKVVDASIDDKSITMVYPR